LFFEVAAPHLGQPWKVILVMAWTILAVAIKGLGGSVSYWQGSFIARSADKLAR
jgi:hypothetical protein